MVQLNRNMDSLLYLNRISIADALKRYESKTNQFWKGIKTAGRFGSTISVIAVLCTKGPHPAIPHKPRVIYFQFLAFYYIEYLTYNRIYRRHWNVWYKSCEENASCNLALTCVVCHWFSIMLQWALLKLK